MESPVVIISLRCNDSISKSYKKISEYMNDNSKELLKEVGE